ncbi:MAG TPA: RNA polymerase sigma-70 factor [Puia sp.]|nr:RNA polymerase sigma-70 factor [Puia sp.]
MSDAAYIKELQERISSYSDMKAYESLYKLLFNGIFRFAYSFVKSKEAAEEIVSDSFIKIWELGTKLAEIDNVKAYLFTITKNNALNYITRNYKQLQLNIDDLEFDDVIVWEDPEEIFLSGEAVNRIKNAIKELPPQCRIIFQLVKVEGLSYQETAAVLGISLSTVRNQMSIGLRKMTESLPTLDLDSQVFRKS